jgi:outer membrane protein OmpA-like peptidoglycan-associated protein
MSAPRTPRAVGSLLALILLATTGCERSVPAASAAGAATVQPGAPGVAPAAQQSAGNSAQAQQGQQSQQGGSLAERLKAIQSGQVDKPRVPLPTWKPFPSGTTPPSIPLVVDLVEVGAVSDSNGDYEEIVRVLDVNETNVRLGVSAELPPRKPSTLFGDAPDAKPSDEPQKISAVRIVDVADLQKAHAAVSYFVNGQTEHFPGTTPSGGSTEVLNALRAGQAVEFHFESDPLAPFAQLGAEVLGEKSPVPQTSNYAGLPMYSCSLHRVEPGDLAFPVLVNDQRVELPAIHAMCSIGDEDWHAYFLDAPATPLGLAGFSPEWHGQVIKIKIPPVRQTTASPQDADTGPPMERALSEKKPVEIYSVYFDFNKATLKPESEPALKQIADILGKHADWVLNVGGHTDNIGGDAFNLDLSRRRAAAVKDALVTRFHIAADSLATSGFGASMPIETNATMEGRARNRRVELQRR